VLEALVLLENIKLGFAILSRLPIPCAPTPGKRTTVKQGFRLEWAKVDV
jgi:hypothetical protein